MSELNSYRPYRVLSIDGGGMRGLYSAALLDTLSERFEQTRSLNNLDIGKGFDLIVGTSTGGILASGLAFGLSIKDIIKMYSEKGPLIFCDPMPEVSKAFEFYRWCLRNRKKPANKNDVLKQTLLDLFGDITIEQLYKKRGIAICIPSVAILREKSRVFKTPHNPKKQLDNKYSLVDICLATSAAPIFLPLVALDWPSDQKSFDVFADGGLWANNPILIGILEALDQCDVKRPIQVISIGTCTAPEGNILDKNEINRGLLGWRVGAKALSLSMNAQASGANFMAQFLQNQLQKLGKNIEVVRIPEAPPSEDQIKYLRLDLASTKALEAFKALGRDDGINAYRLCQDNSNKHGIIISEIFNSMPVLNQKT